MSNQLSPFQTFTKFPKKFIIIIFISSMQGIYTYIPETNYVSREYSVAAILLLLFMVLISLVSMLNLLYFYSSTFFFFFFFFFFFLLLLLLLLQSSPSLPPPSLYCIKRFRYNKIIVMLQDNTETFSIGIVLYSTMSTKNKKKKYI